jgi:hypothetical protein
LAMPGDFVEIWRGTVCIYQTAIAVAEY